MTIPPHLQVLVAAPSPPSLHSGSALPLSHGQLLQGTLQQQVRRE